MTLEEKILGYETIIISAREMIEAIKQEKDPSEYLNNLLMIDSLLRLTPYDIYKIKESYDLANIPNG